MTIKDIETYLKENDTQSGLIFTYQHVDAEQLRILTESLGYRFVHLDGKVIDAKSDFLKHIAERMEFPNYFGYNWDAAFDCLTDMSWWADVEHIFIYYQQFTPFAATHPKDFAVGLNVFRDIATLQNTGGTYVFLLQGDLNTLTISLLKPVSPL